MSIAVHIPVEAVWLSAVKYIEFSSIAYLEMKIYCGQTIWEKRGWEGSKPTMNGSMELC
jgi:hypothetical protein